MVIKKLRTNAKFFSSVIFFLNKLSINYILFRFKAMTEGSVLLVDEISLADDSVLERMNSILEPERTLLLIEETSSAEFREIVAHQNFQFVATMNPGGDFGKKELSPALRNRLVEIWCPAEASQEDLAMITTSKLVSSVDQFAVKSIVDFVLW